MHFFALLRTIKKSFANSNLRIGHQVKKVISTATRLRRECAARPHRDHEFNYKKVISGVYTDQSAQTSPTPQEGKSEENRFGTFNFFWEKKSRRFALRVVQKETLSLYCSSSSITPLSFWLCISNQALLFWLYEVLSDSTLLGWRGLSPVFFLADVVAKVPLHKTCVAE